MNRRQFAALLVRRTIAALLASPMTMVTDMSVAHASDKSPDHWIPLGNRRLKEEAARGFHHGPHGYVNPFSRMAHGNIFRVLQWKLFSKNHFRRFYGEEPVTPVRMDWQQINSRRLTVTFIKHACVLIKDGDTTLLVDPVLGPMFPFIKDFTPLTFGVDEMPAIDRILITHGHYDHLDTTSLSRFAPDTHLVAPPGYDSLFDELGMPQRTILDWFESTAAGRCTVTLLPCNHWTMRNPVTGPNTALWGAYLVETADGTTIFIAGDSAYFDGYRQLGEHYDIDLAIFNLSAYEPRWFMASSHMNPAETCRAFTELNARHMMVVHWGTFRLGDEPVHFPPEDIRKEMQTAGLGDRLIDIRHGQTIAYPP